MITSVCDSEEWDLLKLGIKDACVPYIYNYTSGKTESVRQFNTSLY